MTLRHTTKVERGCLLLVLIPTAAVLLLVLYLERFGSNASTVEASMNRAPTMSTFEAQERVRSRMRDPQSVQFRNTRSLNTGNVAWVCGMYNAKNGFGGYAGFEPFVVTPTQVITATDAEANEAANRTLAERCGT